MVSYILLASFRNASILFIHTGIHEPLGIRRPDMDRHRRRSAFLESVREAIRVRHYSIRTEKTHLHWIKRFILYHGKRHPREFREPLIYS
jgi:hypothetical protein